MKFFRSVRHGQLKKRYLQEGILFEFTGDDHPVFPLSSNKANLLSKLIPEGGKWAALEEMWAAGFLKEKSNHSWILAYDVYSTDDLEDSSPLFEALELPLPVPLEIEVRSFSHVGDTNFRITVEAFHEQFGPLRDGETPRVGSVFVISEDNIVPLTAEQKQIFDIAKGENVDWNSLEERMAYLAQAREAALKIGAKIDSYLRNEEYTFRVEASLDLREDSHEEITLIPRIDGIEDYGIKSGEELIEDTPPTVLTNVVSPTRRRRLVLDKRVRENLSKLPPKGKVRGADVPRLLTNPEQIIPEGFDLSLFSQRVKGIKTKVYNSRPYIHVKRSTGGWFEGIPGIELEDWSPSESSKESATDIGVLPGLSMETYKELVKRARETGDDYVQYKGAWIRVDPDVGEKFEQVLDSLELDGKGCLVIPAGSMLEIYENLGLLEFIDKPSITKDGQLPEDLPEVGVPEYFKGELLTHQLDGYRWIVRLSRYRLGGLLADEMELGKTIQTIAHLLFLKEQGEAGPHLLVVPKTLIENWQREIARFSGGALQTYVYEGSQRIFDPDLFHKIDIVITTYDTLRRDQVKLGIIDWNLVLCDEAQYVKNPTALRTSAVKAMKSTHRLALTGTPVENGLIEFWCIMDFVQPGLLGSWTSFRSKFEHPIIEGDEAEREKSIQQLLEQIKGFYLRRMKSDYLKELPPKKISYREASLGEEQFDIYRRIAQQGKHGGKGAALVAIQKLLIVSAHPCALKTTTALSEDVLKIPCPKLTETIKIIDEVRQRGEKVVIFTDFKSVQSILQRAIRSAFGIWADVINGEVNKNRQLIIDIFSKKEGFNVIILGHQVAGLGLNIVAANHVIHYTRPWNPAKENQATDRVHCIGQNKPVYVYYPFVRDSRFITVEEKLDELIRSKEHLARDVLRPSYEFRIKPEDLLNCLNLAET